MARRVFSNPSAIVGVGLLLGGVSLFQFLGLEALGSNDWLVASGAGLICIGGLLVMAAQLRT